MKGELVSNLFTSWIGNLPIPSERTNFYLHNYAEEKIKVNSVGIKIEGYCKEVNVIKDLLLTLQLLSTGDDTKCTTRLLYDAGFEGVPEYVKVEFKGYRSQVKGLVNFLKSEYGEPKKQSGPTFFQQMRSYNGIEECKEDLLFKE
jgi:hypothetical protein